MAEPCVWITVGARKYKCAYGLEQYVELERLCNAGTGEIRARTSRGRYGFQDGEVYPDLAEYRVSELWEILRQGVIGGNMVAIDGKEQKIDGGFHVDEIIKPFFFGMQDGRLALTKLWAAAYEIITQICEGFDPPKKAEAGENPAPDQTGSTGQESSPTAP